MSRDVNMFRQFSFTVY